MSGGNTKRDLKLFAVGALLFSSFIGFREYRRKFLLDFVPLPDAFTDHQVIWQIIVVATAGTLLSLIVTLIAWLRSDGDTRPAGDAPIPPGKTWLITGCIKAFFGVVILIEGLVTLNVVHWVGGAFLCALGAWWIYRYSRDVDTYEQEMARRSATDRIDPDTSAR